MRCLTLIFLIGLLTGCAHFEIGIEQPVAPTPHPSVTVPLPSETPPTAAASTSVPIVLPTSTSTTIPTATRRPMVQPTATPIVQPPTSTATPTGSTILNFSVEPLEVDPGQSVIVRWSTTSATQVDIVQRAPDTLIYSGTTSLPPSGELTLPIGDQERLWHAYELSVLNGLDVVTQTITVSIRCPYSYFFSPPPPEDSEWACPDGPPKSSAAAQQAFEGGQMIWIETEKRIDVLLNDGRLYTYPDTWTANQPDSNPGLTPPAGRYLPVRGFGKVWTNAPDIRSQLGWAVSEEQGFEAQIQGGWIHCCSRLGAVNRPIYLRNAEKRIIRLWLGEFPPGQWSVVSP